MPELARCCEAVIAQNVTSENVVEVLAMARGEGLAGAALAAWCESFALQVTIPSKSKSRDRA